MTLSILTKESKLFNRICYCPNRVGRPKKYTTQEQILKAKRLSTLNYHKKIRAVYKLVKTIITKENYH